MCVCTCGCGCVGVGVGVCNVQSVCTGICVQYICLCVWVWCVLYTGLCKMVVRMSFDSRLTFDLRLTSDAIRSN